MVEYGPIKSILLNGNLKTGNGELKIKIPFEEIRRGLWQLCILNVGYEALEKVNLITSISSNFVTDVRYNQNDIIETFSPSLALVLLKNTSSNEFKSVQQLEKNWLFVNNLSEYLTLNFNNVRNNQKISIDCNLYVTVLLQRKK